MVGGEGVEAALGQPPDLAVAQRRDAARALALGQERHLADQIARRDLGDQHRLAGVARFVMTKDPERAARHDIDGVGGFALAEQRRAPGQHQERQLVFDGCQDFGSEVGEQRSLLQHLLQPQPGGILARHGETHPPVIPFSAQPIVWSARVHTISRHLSPAGKKRSFMSAFSVRPSGEPGSPR